MNASIFYLVPSARPYCSCLPSCSLPRDEAVPIFSCNFFLPTPFTRYRPLANGTRLPFAFIQNGVPASDRRSRGLRPYPRPLPSAIVSATRASPSWRFISRDADRHFPPLSSLISERSFSRRHVAKLALHEPAAKEGNFFARFSYFSPRLLYFPLISVSEST